MACESTIFISTPRYFPKVIFRGWPQRVKVNKAPDPQLLHILHTFQPLFPLAQSPSLLQLSTKIEHIHGLQAGCDFLSRLPLCCPDLGQLISLLSHFPPQKKGALGQGPTYSPNAIMVFSMERALSKDLLREWTCQNSCYLLLHSHQDWHAHWRYLGNTRTPMVDSSQSTAKPIKCCKVR